ncbi:hypothetical protein BYT27DRAFT_7255501 [Phlegmacium glaucopus]|nr:hypothetical protein BYT27DRAFT_7255501 [Phlegmacium glaucopus]
MSGKTPPESMDSTGLQWTGLTNLAHVTLRNPGLESSEVHWIPAEYVGECTVLGRCGDVSVGCPSPGPYIFSDIEDDHEIPELDMDCFPTHFTLSPLHHHYGDPLQLNPKPVDTPTPLTEPVGSSWLSPPSKGFIPAPPNSNIRPMGPGLRDMPEQILSSFVDCGAAAIALPIAATWHDNLDNSTRSSDIEDSDYASSGCSVVGGSAAAAAAALYSDMSDSSDLNGNCHSIVITMVATTADVGGSAAAMALLSDVSDSSMDVGRSTAALALASLSPAMDGIPLPPMASDSEELSLDVGGSIAAVALSASPAIQLMHVPHEDPAAHDLDVDVNGSSAGSSINISGSTAAAALLASPAIQPMHVPHEDPAAHESDVDVNGSSVGSSIDVGGSTVAAAFSSLSSPALHAMPLHGMNVRVVDVFSNFESEDV